nr:MAG TPA_asm: hypothetical protein [Caudoviricetes sp.]
MALCFDDIASCFFLIVRLKCCQWLRLILCRL